MMSEKSVSTTTSFMNPTIDGMEKPPLSSDSSIDSGCNLSTSDSIQSNHQQIAVSNPLSANAMTNQPYQNGLRTSLLMLPAQPNVPPPPPPLSQLQENLYASNEIYDNRVSIYQQLPDHASNGVKLGATNGSATFVSSCPTNINTHQSHYPSTVLLTSQTSQGQQQSSSHSQTFQQSVINQRSSTSSLESASSAPLMPMNVKGMLLHGLPSEEVLCNWLSSIKCDDQIENFVYHGYDIHLVTRMTPQDLAAIGCKSPVLRKKLLSEIKKLNLEYDIPELDKTMTLDKWLESLKLNQYYSTLISEGYDSVEKACQLTWEDLEEIGVIKLGHQKRLLMAIDKIRKSAKQQEESQNDNAIYDVHPNHRISLNGTFSDGRMGTIGRVRSGLFQTRSGANLDHRGLPIAKVMPALKHVGGSVLASNTSKQTIIQINGVSNSNSTQTTSQNGASSSNCNTQFVTEQHQIYDSTTSALESMNLNELTSTMRRNRPLPPVRTNSLKVSQPSACPNSQPIYGCKYNVTNGINCSTNSTSFLRTPKLGTLTATTNKMLTSGGHIQTLDGEQAPTNRSIYSPVREAPLPPTQLHVQLIQQNIPEKIEEESSAMIASSHHGRDSYAMSMGNTITNEAFMNLPQLANSDEFPPAPPCQDQLSTS